MNWKFICENCAKVTTSDRRRKMKSQTTVQPEEATREKAIRLFTYLRELVQMRSKVVASLEEYEQVLWLDDIPREPECYCAAWSDSQEEQTDIWLQIDKPPLKQPPEVPAKVRPWIDRDQFNDSSLTLPELRQQITERLAVESDDIGPHLLDTVVRDLSDSPEIEELWDTYVEQEWWQWAEEDRRVQAVQSVYNKLFSMYQRQERLGETYEVVLGLGCLTWRSPSGRDIKRHAIVAQATVSFDAETGVMTLAPAGEGANPVLEQDMLEPRERPDASVEEAIAEQVTDMGDDLFDGASLRTIFSSWANSLAPTGQFDDSLTAPGAPGDDPSIHLAPAVILRRRTERSTLKVYDQIIGELKQNADVPPGVEQLVTIVEDRKQSESPSEDVGDPRVSASEEEIHFPLPANEEQLAVAGQLTNAQGVLVQGPPDTGKSLTIANLICHLLATGNRVLVTSHTPRALKVLKTKIPKEVSDLCVTLLGNDRAAIESMENSVQGITDRFNSWNERENDREGRKLESQLDGVRRQKAVKSRELRQLREAEINVHPPSFGGYEGTKQSIAMRVRQQEAQYSWLTAEPGHDDDPPLTDSEALELLNLLKNIDQDKEQELRQHSVDPAELMSPNEFEALADQENVLKDQLADPAGETNSSDPSPFRQSTREFVVGLVGGIDSILNTYQSLESHLQEAWVTEAAQQILGDRDRAWRELLSLTNERLEDIEPLTREASSWAMMGIEDTDVREVRADAQALLQHLDAGGKLGWGPFRPTVVRRTKYLTAKVRIDGRGCSSPEDLRKLIDWITVFQTLELLDTAWSTHVTPPVGSFSTRIAEYRDLCEPLAVALGLHGKVQEIQRSISTVGGVVEPVWHEPSALEDLRNTAQSQLTRIDLANVQDSLGQLERGINLFAAEIDAHPLVEELAESVRSLNTHRYGVTVDALFAFRRESAQLERRNDLFDRLSAASPELASKIRNSCLDPTWESRLTEFTASWNWARARNWLRGLNDPDTERGLTAELDALRSQEQDVLTGLVAAKAWGHCCSRLTAHERQALQAWSLAVRRIGKGTGKYANMHRRAARKNLDQCRSAIPAWIMPIHRVAESIRPGQDLFDVIIVDEASQSGTDALFLSYLANKIVVVGDEQQISPDHVGLNREDVEQLRTRYIADLPFSDALGADNSFFDQAMIRYPAQIRLLEHFRCMPEIIQYSNNLCYSSQPLIPLRQRGTDHLSPVIETRYVQDGYLKDGGNVNPPEAQAVVDQIIECCRNPDYEGKSMGVIHLVDVYQGRFIEDLLLKQLGPEEMVKRQIVCGNAYAFQGDERDVMFLSMVTAVREGRRMGVLSSPGDKRRFNVAASRAKDQMWLFHSVMPEDLSPLCYRRDLLEYCLNPKIQTFELGGLNVGELRELARTANRDRDDQPPPFDSWFEVDVFLKVAGRGYRVIPQFRVHGRRIDLVVEGMRGRLAVECDGDEWHGPDQYEKDMARQRDLERAGFRFWTVRGSTFNLDPDEAMESLWELLDRMDIRPDRAEPDERPVANRPEETEPADEAPHSFRAQELDASETAVEAPRVPAQEVPKPQPPVDPSTPDTTPNIPMAPYQEFKSKPLLDPRKLTTNSIMSELIEIVRAEGPVIARRAYRIYANAAGIRRVRQQLRATFDKALDQALSAGHLFAENEWDSSDQQDHVVRPPGTPAISARMRGNRTLDEIPPREIAALMGAILAKSPLDEEPLFRSVLQAYELGRLTTKAQNILEFAHNICLQQNGG